MPIFILLIKKYLNFFINVIKKEIMIIACIS